MTVEEFKDIWGKCTKKWLLFAITKIGLKEAPEEVQISLDKIETGADFNMDLKIDFKMLHYKNDMEKDVTLDLQMKLANIVLIKGNIHRNNNNNKLEF